MDSSQWENWHHLFCRKVSFLTGSRCRSGYEWNVDSVDRTAYVVYDLFQKSLYEVGETRNTICTNRYANYLLKSTSNEHSIYVVNQKLEHIDDISFKEFFDSFRVFFYIFLRPGICIYVGHFF
jgi:hypothetical protein